MLLHRRSPLALVLLLLSALALAGCEGRPGREAPTAPSTAPIESVVLGHTALTSTGTVVSRLRRTPLLGSPVDEDTDLPPAIWSARAWIAGDSLYVLAYVDRDAADFDRRWTVQTYLDVDRDPETGAAGGYEYIGRLIEVGTDASFPIRTTEGVSPDPGSGGWGPVVGLGRAGTEAHRILIAKSLDAIGDFDGLDLSFELYRLEPGDHVMFGDAWRGTVLPPESASARL